MGTRINVLMPHFLRDWTDREEVIRTLIMTIPEAKAVSNYWLKAASQPESDEDWTALPLFPPPETRDYHRYVGPGSLFVEINPHCIRVRTGGRWRGFLSIQPLRTIHSLAFKAIANSFDANTFRCFPDHDIPIGAFWDGASFHSCCAILDKCFGEAVFLYDAIDQELAVETDTKCHSLQYVS